MLLKYDKEFQSPGRVMLPLSMAHLAQSANLRWKQKTSLAKNKIDKILWFPCMEVAQQK